METTPTRQSLFTISSLPDLHTHLYYNYLNRKCYWRTVYFSFPSPACPSFCFHPSNQTGYCYYSLITLTQVFSELLFKIIMISPHLEAHISNSLFISSSHPLPLSFRRCYR
ncbi:unnamed protein product [Calicophoron daubneyi]|uniref:Uncharacterized protein n=1 Tax=Calicophoron daubneyi TaxID=300641 RepID=A0AAV2TAC1_CALDB